MSAQRSVTSAAELINDVGVTIKDVSFFRISAELREFDDDSEVPSTPTEAAPVYALKLRYDEQELGVRLSTKLDLGVAEIVVDATIDYEVNENVEIPEVVRLEFANEVGLMALLPYVRQAIADISQRVVGETVLMPVIPRGGLHFTANERAEH